MPTLEERLAYLEGRVEEQGRGMADLGGGFVRMDHRMDGLDQKIDRFREELASRMDGFREELAGRMDRLDQKLSRRFVWLVGAQLTVLLAVIGALLGR